MSAYDYKLEIEKYRDVLSRFISQNKHVIVKGPTGCGKSTFVPLLLAGKRVAIIEPRRIAVIGLYNVLMKHIPTLGYKMRFNKHITADTTTTIFTDGAFLNEVEDLEYDCIVIDEVHERNIRTDIILGVLKEQYEGQLILMSATLDTKKLESFFGAKTFEVPGYSHPVELHYLERPTADYIIEAYLTIKRILKENRTREGPRDILVFLAGEEDIEELFGLCKRIPAVDVCKMHSRISDLEQQQVFKEGLSIRIILSTNICESSLTIPNIKFVVDSGLCKVKIFNRINHLGIVSISHESATQRMGRCNRVGPGTCFRLYTRECVLPEQVPEIRRSDLSSMLLLLIGAGKNILTFPLLDYPPVTNVVHAILFLFEKRCINIICNGKNMKNEKDVKKFTDNTEFIKSTAFSITSYGRRLLRHPFDVHIAHFYEQCIQAGVGWYGAIVSSLMSLENYNFMSGQKPGASDLEYLVNLMDGYTQTGDRQEYARKHNVPYKGMETARRIFKSLNKSKRGDIKVLEKVFSRSFSHNLCKSNGDGSYKMIKGGLKVYIHPSSGFFKKREKSIVIAEVFSGTKVYANIVGKYYEIC